MSTLATMLNRAGLIGEEEAARAASRAKGTQTSIVAALVELGMAKEGQLVGFVQSKLMIPQVTPGILSVLDAPAERAIDAETAWRHEVLPVSIDDVGNLTLAMADPTDVAAVDAVVARSRTYVIRAVAPRTALLRALERFYGPKPDLIRPQVSTPRRASATNGTAPTAPTASAPPPAATDAVPPTGRFPGAARPSVIVAPPVRSPPAPQAEVDPGPWPDSVQRGLTRLASTVDRDGVTAAMMDVLAEGFGRVILFVHAQGVLRGRDCRGPDLVVDAVRQVRIPMSGPSTFAAAIGTGAPHFGSWSEDSRINVKFAAAVGGISGDVLVAPIKVSGRVPLVVFASGTDRPLHPPSLLSLFDATGAALQRVILAKKGGTIPPPSRSSP